MCKRQTRGPGGLVALVLAIVAVTVLSAGWASVASAAPGSLEICKMATGGAAGVTFNYTATRETVGTTLTFSVVGGTCSAPLSAQMGKWDITEDLSSNLWSVVGVAVTPKSQLVKGSEDDSQGFITVKVADSAETQVSYSNTQSTSTLKICKYSSSPAIQGSSFSFTLNTITNVSAVAGVDKPNAGCSGPVSYQPGTKVTVVEAIPAGERVADISPYGNLQLNGSTKGTAKVTVGTGANSLYYDNEPFGPAQNGYLEVCKTTNDQFTTGTFQFLLTGFNFSDTENVTVGQCTAPILVPAGNITVSETPTPNMQVTAITTDPATALGPNNLANGTATVVVPVSQTSNNEVELTFQNSTITATLKVCKVLSASSGALAGSTFNFGVTSSAGQNVPLSIIASAGLNGACKLYPTALPVGSQVAVSETGVPYIAANGGVPGAGATSTITLSPGVNTVSFLNQAYGTAEICKNLLSSDAAYLGTAFSYTVGTQAVAVKAGKCSPALTLPVGSTTITEASKTGFSFVGSTATSPDGSSNRALSGTATNGGNPLTISVLYPGGSGNETLVTFTNTVIRTQLKICKQITPGSTDLLGTLSYQFTYSTIVNGQTQNFPAETLTPPYPGCTGLLLSPGVPIINADGSRTVVVVAETQNNPAAQVADISVDNGDTNGTTTINPNPNKTTGAIAFNPKAGIDIVTYTNTEVPPPNQTG